MSKDFGRETDEQAHMMSLPDTEGTPKKVVEYIDSCENEGTRHEAAEDALPAPFVCPAIPPFVLLLLVFSSLAQSLSSSVLSLFMNIDLAMGPVEVTMYWVYVGLTSWVQPAVGYAADALVVRQERRRPLFMVAVTGNTVIFFLYCIASWPTSSFSVFVTLSLVSQLCMQGMYIPLNGLLVEVGRTDAETEDESVARMSAIMSKAMVWRSTGSFAGLLLQVLLSLTMSVRHMLAVAAITFAVTLPIMSQAPRELFFRTSAGPGGNFYTRLAEVGRRVKEGFKSDGIRSEACVFVIVLLFVFFYTLMPDGGGVYFNYLYAVYSFPTWFYSVNSVIGNVGSIAGAYIFSTWMDRRAMQEAAGAPHVSMFWIFVIGSVAWSLGYVTNIMVCTGFVEALGIPIKLFLPIDNFFVALFARFAYMPTLVMAAEHAPKNFEATAFEVFSVASMGGGMASSAITSVIATVLPITRADYSRLWILMTISVVCKLVPIIPAYFLPEQRHAKRASEMTIVPAEGEDTERSTDSRFYQ